MDAPPDQGPFGVLLGRLRERLLALWSLPGSFVAAMLLLNALFLPFRERYHDALLYEFQVLNQVEGGRFANDIYLRFGSQDSYSLFSWAAVPLASLLGGAAAFFVLYVAGKALFFWAAVRLTRILCADQVSAALGMLALAVYDLPLGGLQVFHLNENFFTPRLLAMALALFGLERMLAGRMPAALLLLICGLLVHPLMGFGGLLLMVLWYISCGAWRRTVAILACLAGAGALTAMLIPSIGLRLFGAMDPLWLSQVGARLAVLVGAEWTVRDWIDVAASAAVALLAWRTSRQEPRTRAFLGALTAVTALAALGTILTGCLPYALLLQGQPFRALWLVQTLRIPLALAVAQCWWAADRPAWRVSAALLLGYCLGPFDPVGLAIGLVLFVMLWSLMRRAPASWRADRLPLSLAGSVAGGIMLPAVHRWSSVVGSWDEILPGIPSEQRLYFFSDLIDPACRLLLGAALLLLLTRLAGPGRTFRWAALGLCVLIQLAAVTLGRLPLSGPESGHRATVAFVGKVLDARGAGRAGPPTVYWAANRVDCLWFDLEANSYYSSTQLAGTVFSRATALEGRRRAVLAAPFEIDLARRQPKLLGDQELELLNKVCGANLAAGPPSPEDLLRLCADEGLDFIVARQGFPDLYAAADHGWFIYDCRALRCRAKYARHAGAGADAQPCTPRLGEASGDTLDSSP